MRHLNLLMGALLAAPALTAHATTWTTTIDPTHYNGDTGSITFNDHGYIGPGGAGANNFTVGSGFNASRIGQIQHVVTNNPDGLTPDAPHSVVGDFTAGATQFPNANMDGQVNFYGWGYTTVGGSTFNNMQIDKAGNYYVARNNMNFKYYDTFQYTDATGVNPSTTFDTQLNFQPYALSDAKGWCGSVLASSADALEAMGGQITFDFAFDVYLDGSAPTNLSGTDSFMSTEIVPGFVMRSYGDYLVSVTTAGGYTQSFSGAAVMNNTNPLTGAVDPNYHDLVSFLGAGVIPAGAWVFIDPTTGVLTVAADQSTVGTADGETRADGAVWHHNAFGGYAFLMRADGARILDYVAPAYSDYTSVAPTPEPSTYALMAIGIGLVGVVARRRHPRA